MNDQRPHRFVSTAIPYVNAAPHIGFALELIQADALVRSYRLAGDNVYFQGGSDENSIKNVQAAEVAGLPVNILVERNADKFVELSRALNISIDNFVRTSASEVHKAGVEKLWRACASAGDVYKKSYNGLYCTGCEQFYKEADLTDGCCPEHGTRPDLVEEENWFFRLSRYQETLSKLIEKNAIEIVPLGRKKEVLAWLSAGLEDFSISRSGRRARGWGIPVPDDAEQVVYVWFDALVNYITGLGYGSDSFDNLLNYWDEAETREHVIGKGITRFHALYWPAMLISAGMVVPTRVFVHGYVTVEGKKIGKSAGNTVDPLPLAASFGRDALRYYLLRHIRSTEDGDFSDARFQQAYVSELAGQFGNLVHRSIKMMEAYRGGVVSLTGHEGQEATERLLHSSEALAELVASRIAEFAFDRALEGIWQFIADANRTIAEVQPWALAKSGDDAELDRCLFALFRSLHVIAYCLFPFLPDSANALFAKLGTTPEYGPGLADFSWPARVASGAPLFPPKAD